MNHVAFLKSLPPAAKSRLTERSDAAGLSHLALYLGLLFLASAGIVAQVPFWPVLMLPQGLLLCFLFTLSHECTHQTPFATRKLNELTGHCIAPIIALPFTWFRYFHLAHHKYTNDPERDPELEGHGRPVSLSQWLWYLSGWAYWRGNLATLWRNATGAISAGYLPARQHPAMQHEARIILVIYACAVSSLLISPVLLWLWFIPVLLGQPFLRLYLLAEHGLCPPVANMLENSRTTYTSRAIRFLAWNMPYHAEHHSFPSVPFHQLPALHDLAKPHLKTTSEDYGTFTQDYLRSLER